MATSCLRAPGKIGQWVMRMRERRSIFSTKIDFSNAHAQQAWFAKVGAWFCGTWPSVSLNDKINGMN